MSRPNSIPVHPRGHITPNQQPRIRGSRIALLGGAVALFAGATGYALLGGGSEQAERSSADSLGSTPSASASQYPQLTESSAPVKSETLPPATETSPTPQDIHYALRRAAAERYDRCDVSGFTNDGVVRTKHGKRVRLDMSITYEQDPASVESRTKGESRDLNWDNPAVIAIPLRADGSPDANDMLEFASRTDRLNQNSSVYLPVKPGKGGDYAIGVLTNAVTPYGEGEMETITVTYCNTIENQGGNEWRQSAYDETIPEITSVDVYRP